MFHASVLIGSFAVYTVLAQGLLDVRIVQVVERLAEGATHSWELGTRAQALLELNSPFYAVFSNSTLPPPHNTPSFTNLTDVIEIARLTSSRLKKEALPEALVPNDSAAGDPASIGIATLIANWTNAPGGDYAQDATGQVKHLLNNVPRTSDGAISHQESQVQLWSDFVYMVPPFLAYYGVLTHDLNVLAESYNQIKLYRKYLRDTEADNIWRHVLLGSWTDDGHWSTGNGWAAAGIIRVLATIKHSNFANQFQREQGDLTDWVVEILNGMYRYQTWDHLFYNYADNSETFEDAASAALMASVTYRLAVLTQNSDNILKAELTRKALIDGSHLDSKGWLTPVVNPYNMGVEGSQSPEGQAFVVEMYAAWRDWVSAGSPGIRSLKSTEVDGITS